MADLVQGLVLDLANTLLGHADHAADLLERLGALFVCNRANGEPLLDDGPFDLGQIGEVGGQGVAGV